MRVPFNYQKSFPQSEMLVEDKQFLIYNSELVGSIDSRPSDSTQLVDQPHLFQTSN